MRLVRVELLPQARAKFETGEESYTICLRPRDRLGCLDSAAGTAENYCRIGKQLTARDQYSAALRDKLPY